MLVKERGFFAIALSGGSLISMIGKLCEAPYNKTVDWAKWHIFWADERVVAKNHSDSNYKLAKDGLLSKGSQSFQSQATNLEQTITPTRGPSSCKLQHMTKKHMIAYGRLQGTELPEVGFYRIVLDEIVDGSVDLFDGERKLGDVILGDVLDWPIIRTILY